MKKLLLTLVLLLLPINAAASQLMERAAVAMVGEMNGQLAARFGHMSASANGISIVLTTPVDIADLESSNVVALQMQEYLAACLVRSGYSVQEIRKGKSLLLRPGKGEFLLTRKKNLSSVSQTRSSFTLVGTYNIAGGSITFNIRLVETAGTEVHAMSAVTLPLTGEMRAKLASANGKSGGDQGFLIQPSVFGRLP